MPAPRAPRTRQSESPGYVVHEWGVIAYRALEQDRAPVARAGHFTLIPQPSPEPAHVYKPVVYIHLDRGLARIRFTASLEPPNGRVVEHWPLGAVTGYGSRVQWRNVVAWTANACATSYPSLLDPACTSIGDQLCEASDARAYEATDGACLRFEGDDYDHILYRASVSRDRLPYDVTVRGADAVLGRRDSTPAATVFRVVRDVRARTTHVTRLATPAGRPISLGPSGQEPEREGVRDELFEPLATLGLTAPEAAVFERTWAPMILDPPRVTDDTRDRPLDAIYYWLTPETANALLPLTFAPAPRELRRALLVRVELPSGLAIVDP